MRRFLSYLVSKPSEYQTDPALRRAQRQISSRRARHDTVHMGSAEYRSSSSLDMVTLYIVVQRRYIPCADGPKYTPTRARLG